MIKINLLPREFQDKGKGQDWVILGYGCLVLLALAGAGSYFGKVHAYKNNLAKKARWAAALSDIKVKVARVEQLDAQKAVLNAKKNTVVQLFQGRLLYPKFMENFYQNVPRQIWVTDMSLNEDPATKNLKVVATANSLTTEAIADWLQLLQSKSSEYSDVSLSTIESKTNAETKTNTYGFSMTFIYHPPAASGT
jgi:Tfp pilus assembly protein PilN